MRRPKTDIATETKMNGGKRRKPNSIPSGRESVRSCGEKCVKIIVVVEDRTTSENRANREKKYEALDVRVNKDGLLTVDDCATTIEATIFLYNLQ